MKVTHDARKARYRLEELRKRRGYKYLKWNKFGDISFDCPKGIQIKNAYWQEGLRLYYLTYASLKQYENNAVLHEEFQIYNKAVKEKARKELDKHIIGPGIGTGKVTYTFTW